MVITAAVAKRSTSAQEKTTMNKFARWSQVVHSTLAKSHPKLKLGQAQEILAAAFGHRTYASLRAQDLALIEQDAKYILLDDELPIRRAESFGIPMTPDEWGAAAGALRPSGVSGGSWITHEKTMHLAARLVFEDTRHAAFDEITRAIGMPDGRHATTSRCLSAEGSLPEELKFVVEGEVRAFSMSQSDVNLAVPVTCEVAFIRTGRRFYAEGSLLSVQQAGQPHSYEPEFEMDSYGMSED
jgi:hypothetical protein